MANRHIQVSDHPGLVRDKSSGAILNINKNSIRQAQAAKKKRQSDKDRLEILEDKLERALNLLEVLAKQNG